MKKLFLFTAIISLAFAATPKVEAQTTQNPVFTLSSFKFKPTPSNSTSTVTNTSADTVSLYLPGFYNVVAIQPVVTKASGTMAGTVILQGSINGVNFVNTDTLTLTNVTTNTGVFTKTNPPYVYYRAVQSGATTVSSTMQVFYTARHQ